MPAPRCFSTFSSFPQIKTFNEACVMVRKPALELFTYLRNTNFAHPAVRYVICIFLPLMDGRTQFNCERVSSRGRGRWFDPVLPAAV